MPTVMFARNNISIFMPYDLHVLTRFYVNPKACVGLLNGLYVFDYRRVSKAVSTLHVSWAGRTLFDREAFYTEFTDMSERLLFSVQADDNNQDRFVDCQVERYKMFHKRWCTALLSRSPKR